MARFLLNLVPVPKGRKFDLNAFAMAIDSLPARNLLGKQRELRE